MRFKSKLLKPFCINARTESDRIWYLAVASMKAFFNRYDLETAVEVRHEKITDETRSARTRMKEFDNQSPEPKICVWSESYSFVLGRKSLPSE